jgi:succinoglycan biosynthesis transport protein ExoP
MANPSPEHTGKGATVTDTPLKNRDVRYELVAETGAEFSSEPPLRLLHRVLRGRYALVAMLAATLCVLGALVGHNVVSPTYQSTGLVRVAGALTPILYESDENRAPPMFDAYVASQVTYLQSRQVLDMAVASDAMREIGWPSGTNGVADLQQRLSVSRGRGEQVISVAVTHSDPAMAQTATNAVLEAFKQCCINPDSVSIEDKQITLTRRQAELEDQIQSIREQILAQSDQYGHAAVARMHQRKVEELVAIDHKLAELRLARTRLEVGEQDGVAQDASIIENDAEHNTQLSKLKQQEVALLAEIGSLNKKYGDSHPIIRELNRQLDSVRLQIELRRNVLSELVTNTNSSAIDDAEVVNASLMRLDQVAEQYNSMRSQVHDEATRLGRQSVILAGLVERETELRERLIETNRRLDELEIEASRDDMSRVRVIAAGDYPAWPIKDRRNGLAAAGAIFGAVSAVIIVFFVGLTDPRMRYADELESLDLPTPVIATIPELVGRNRTSEQRAARGVHQLRNLLELQSHDPARNVHAITSADRSEGKTSIALALAASYAAAGRKTLLIDADVTHASMSSELALNGSPGLCEAIGPGDRSGQVHQTGQENLWAMPIGSARGLDPEDLSRDKLVWLLDALRTRFDAIIIDTGPIMTSVEACLISAVSDRVIMTVGRNQNANLIRSAIVRLDQVGAEATGIVFNRADASDFKQFDARSQRTPARAARLVPGATERNAEDDHEVAALAGVIRRTSQTDTQQTRKKAA